MFRFCLWLAFQKCGRVFESSYIIQVQTQRHWESTAQTTRRWVCIYMFCFMIYMSGVHSDCISAYPDFDLLIWNDNFDNLALVLRFQTETVIENGFGFQILVFHYWHRIKPKIHVTAKSLKAKNLNLCLYHLQIWFSRCDVQVFVALQASTLGAQQTVWRLKLGFAIPSVKWIDTALFRSTWVAWPDTEQWVILPQHYIINDLAMCRMYCMEKLQG